MPRAYIRLDPGFDERKEFYPDGAYAALIATFCLAEGQPQRGRFRSAEYLRRMLGRRGRWVKFLIDHRDVIEQPDGRLYVDGWDDWQEGDVTVPERMRRLRARRKRVTPSDTADVTDLRQNVARQGEARQDGAPSPTADSFHEKMAGPGGFVADLAASKAKAS